MTAGGPAMPARGARSFWLRQMLRWHWISAAISLVGMMLFAITGVTLNHAADIPANPHVVERAATLPAALQAELAQGPRSGNAALPPSLGTWLAEELAVRAGDAEAEWSAEEIYLSLPRPGGDASLSIDRESGEVQYELTTRGVIALLNDLHKGRHAGAAWAWFIDIFAAACVVFCLTGLVLLWLHAGMRPSTWPLVGFGLVAPLLLFILFIH